MILHICTHTRLCFIKPVGNGVGNWMFALRAFALFFSYSLWLRSAISPASWAGKRYSWTLLLLDTIITDLPRTSVSFWKAVYLNRKVFPEKVVLLACHSLCLWGKKCIISKFLKNQSHQQHSKHYHHHHQQQHYQHHQHHDVDDDKTINIQHQHHQNDETIIRVTCS